MPPAKHVCHFLVSKRIRERVARQGLPWVTDQVLESRRKAVKAMFAKDLQRLSRHGGHVCQEVIVSAVDGFFVQARKLGGRATNQEILLGL
jgi:hypothetical protein